MTGYPVELQQPGADPTLLRDELLHVIERGIAAHPRTLQRHIGPSEIGTPCPRRLAHKLAGTPEQPRPPAWRPIVGVAVHNWLAEQFEADVYDDRHNPPGTGDTWRERWLVEERISAGMIGPDELDGSCDLFCQVTGTAVDWKIVGPTSLNAKRKAFAAGLPPEPTYRVQLHVYGAGWVARGCRVERVALMALPSNGELADYAFWSEPYDPDVAAEAIGRANGYTLAAGSNPGGWAPLIRNLPTADDRCGMYCPFYRYGHDQADVTACGGHPGTKAATRTQLAKDDTFDAFA